VARKQSGARQPRERTGDLRILKEIAETLNGSTEVEQAIRESLARVADLLGLKTGWVWLIDPTSGRFYSAAARDLPPFLSDPVRMTGRTCWCIDAYRSGQLTAENIDVIECSRLRAALVGERPATRGLRYHASIPLNFGVRRLGIMNVATPRWRRLTRRELDLLQTIASQMGVAIERARLAQESVRLARAEERARFARDLHDTLTQGLTAIGLHIEASLGAVHDAGARTQLEQALSVARSSLDEARRSLRALRGSPLAGRPLAAALAALAREMTADTGVRVRVRAADDVPLPPAVEEELFRIASEALMNVRRHAQAMEVELILVRDASDVRLTISDDGRGFDAKAPSSGFGLAGMRERAALAGGTLAIRSSAGKGTEVSAHVPLDVKPS
jgi:two-component system, NarL family, sensor kinase